MKRAKTNRGPETMTQRSKTMFFLFSTPLLLATLLIPDEVISKVNTSSTTSTLVRSNVKRIQVGTCLVEKSVCNLSEDLDPWQYHCDLNSRLVVAKVGKHSYKTSCKPQEGYLNELGLTECGQLSGFKPFLEKLEAEVTYLTVDCNLAPSDFIKE